MAGAYLKDSGTLDTSNNYLRMEPQTIRPRLGFSQWEYHYAIGGKIRTVVILYMILLLTSPNDVFFYAGQNTTILFLVQIDTVTKRVCLNAQPEARVWFLL